MKFLNHCLLLVLLTFIGGISHANAETYVRKDASTPAAKADLAALQVAMGKMKNLPCDNPLSWYYQGGMHWTPDARTLAKNPFCASYDAKHPDPKWAWDTCASHDADGFSTIHFLAWHRLYVYHLEKIVRKLSGKQDFALPYWNYVSLNPGQPQQLIMPELFWSPANISKNSLYTAARMSSLNQGKPLDAYASNYLLKDAKVASQDNDYATFNTDLNNGIHDYMHGYIGGSDGSPPPNTINQQMFNEIDQFKSNGLMGNISSAAFDPIFWMHHGNIDRLFQQWTDSIRGQKITMQDLMSVPDWPYDFFDENGKKVTYTKQQVFDILYNLDYRYDDQKTVSVQMAAVTSVTKETVISSAKVNKAVSAAGAQFTLALPDASIPVQALSAEKAPTKSIVLELETTFDAVPQGRYEAYVNLPKVKISDAEKEKHYAGPMHFFVAKPHHGHKGRRVFRFDLTDELNDPAVLSAGAKNGLTVSILGVGGNTKTGFTVNKANVYTYEK